jgi:hypothetical protein
MDFSTLFGIYYGLYRGEATPPASTDDEWKIAVRNYNDALLRMHNMDDTKWNFNWSTLQNSSATKTLSATTTYTAPTDMQEPGGMMTFIDSNNNRTTYPIVQPHEVQAIDKTTIFGYFTGNAQSGFTLHINPVPAGSYIGMGLDYDYYKKPTLLIASTDQGTVETGTSIVAGGDPAFYYNHMLAQRFRVSRNWPAYQTALRDSEEALKGMKLKNNSGSYYNQWSLIDTSGSGFGV